MDPVDIGMQGNELILYNDDINTFDFVIDTLIEVVGHTSEQAEQCALVAHTKGKCGIRQGVISILEPLHQEMKRRGLITIIK